MKSWAWLLFLFVIAPVGGGSSRVLAQEVGQSGDAPDAGESPENPEAARQAREHFEAGLGHFEARRFRESIREFEAAGRLVPSADLWFNIARAHEELSEHELAATSFRRYLRDRVDPPDREQVEQRVEVLLQRAEEQRNARRRRPTTGTLRLRASAEGAQIRVGSRDVGTAPIDVPLTLSPGRHPLTVRLEGHVPFRAEVVIEPGVATGAYPELRPATQYQAIQGQRIFTWIAGGLAILAYGASGWMALESASRQNDMDYAGAEDWAISSDYALGAGLVLSLGAVLLYFVEGRAVGTERVSQVAQLESP